MMKTIPTLWQDFLAILYPNLCLACGKNQIPKKEITCVSCIYFLPATNFHELADNSFEERFWGRIPVQAGASLYHFTKEGRTRRLMHQLKYKGKKIIGSHLGRQYGNILAQAARFKDVELIVPVPIHPRRRKVRGYNQSDYFAQGLADILKIPCAKEGLIRINHGKSQTKKTRIERFKSVENAFAVNHKTLLSHKHILLVDDVLTTGATLEACARKILELPNTRVSMATMAFANF